MDMVEYNRYWAEHFDSGQVHDPFAPGPWESDQLVAAYCKQVVDRTGMRFPALETGSRKYSNARKRMPVDRLLVCK